VLVLVLVVVVVMVLVLVLVAFWPCALLFRDGLSTMRSLDEKLSSVKRC
jgi:hypothetical protein